MVISGVKNGERWALVHFTKIEFCQIISRSNYFILITYRVFLARPLVFKNCYRKFCSVKLVTKWSYLRTKILGIFLILVILSAVTSVISITIFGFGLEQKPCMDRLPWNLMELIYPVFMVILLGCAAIGTNNTFISLCLIIVFFLISWT